jgi:transposase
VIQTPKPGLESCATNSPIMNGLQMLPNKPRGVPRVNDRRVLNGIFWILRSGAPRRDLPEAFGPYTTCYNRFVRWRRAGVWGRIIDALAAAHDAAVQMIDTSIVRVHQLLSCVHLQNTWAFASISGVPRFCICASMVLTFWSCRVRPLRRVTHHHFRVGLDEPEYDH